MRNTDDDSANVNADDAVVAQTLARGLQVLRAFGNDVKPLTNAEICRRTSLPKATVSRITTVLVGEGYLVRIPETGAFQLGRGAVSIGNAFLGSSDILAFARPLVERLASDLGMSTGLAVRDRLEMRYVMWCRDPQTMTLKLRTGSAVPMAASAAGQVYLASQPLHIREDLLSQLEQSDQMMGMSKAAVRKTFDDFTTDGYCIALDSVQKTTFGIAVPVSVESQVMVLTCGGARVHLSRFDLSCSAAPRLFQVAREIQDFAKSSFGTSPSSGRQYQDGRSARQRQSSRAWKIDDDSRQI